MSLYYDHNMSNVMRKLYFKCNLKYITNHISEKKNVSEMSFNMHNLHNLFVMLMLLVMLLMLLIYYMF